jgi:hypothetical protein
VTRRKTAVQRSSRAARQNLPEVLGLVTRARTTIRRLRAKA